ncbi:S-adenosyl-L-methionine-dependent methyltransferase [Chytridium lagenaria]|nr:S-adenosyl-L-methionine-dependent methyltransferase [Chytridium lagenaria]
MGRLLGRFGLRLNRSETEGNEKIDGLTLRKSTMSTEMVDDSAENSTKGNEGKQGRKDKDGRNRRDDPRPEVDDGKSPQEKIKDQVTPLWRKAYDLQLNDKTLQFKNAFGVMKKKLTEFLFNKDITRENKEHLMWLKNSGMKRGICPVSDCVPSPQLSGYRTKCEFTIGFDLEGKISVGFLLGLYKDGITTVISPEGCDNVSEHALNIAKEVQAIVQDSPYVPYDRTHKTGFWKLIQVRTQDSGEAMIIVQVSSLHATPKEIKSAQDTVVARFTSPDCKAPVTTILWQIHDGPHNGISDSAPFEPILGPGYIHENLLGLKFRISPTAFFQVNTQATEKLYSKIGDLCLPSDSTTDSNIVLLDLCCGTGTIGLTMAPRVKRVIGIELVPEAVQDAEENAKSNGIENVHYVTGKVEDVIREVLPFVKNNGEVGNVEEIQGRKRLVETGDVVVAVLDPPRSGVGASVTRAIRGCEGIQRIIYVSCDFNQSMGNIVDFCRPPSNKFKGIPFRPVRALPFDLFPHTSHCELVIELRRVDDPCFLLPPFVNPPLAVEGGDEGEK